MSRRLAPSAAVGKPGELSLSQQSRWWSQGPETGRAGPGWGAGDTGGAGTPRAPPRAALQPTGSWASPAPTAQAGKSSPGGSSAPSWPAGTRAQHRELSSGAQNPRGSHPAPRSPPLSGQSGLGTARYATRGERDRGPLRPERPSSHGERTGAGSPLRPPPAMCPPRHRPEAGAEGPGLRVTPCRRGVTARAPRGPVRKPRTGHRAGP